MTSAAPKTSVILPAYNESANIVPLVSEIKRALAGRPKEILVVDDNSPDGTAELVRARFADDPEVRVIVRLRDRGFANSIREGLEQATGEHLVVMDSDFNHPPDSLPFMLESLAYYDAVFASRFLYGGLMVPRSRHLCSWLFNLFVRFATGGDITDNLYGYFAIRRAALERCDFDAVFYGYGEYCIRLLYALQHDRASILQFPSVIGRRRGGTGNSAFVKTLRLYTMTTVKLAWQGRLVSKHRAPAKRLQEPCTSKL